MEKDEEKTFAIVTDITKCDKFGEIDEDNDNKVIAYAVVRFCRANAGASRFAIASLNDNVPYVLTYDLSVLYTDKEFFNEKGKFLANDAYKAFCEEMPKGAKEQINLFDIELSEISTFDKVWNVESKNEVIMFHIATYGNRENALNVAKRGLNRALKDKIYTSIEPQSEDED